MKGSKTLGFLLVFAGIILIYAGYKNVPILSVLGIGTAASSAGGTASGSNAGGAKNVGTATGGTKAR